MIKIDMSGKNVLVTGAGGGLGGGISEVFAKAGAKVYVADLKADMAEAEAAKIKAEGGEAIACQLDVTDEAAIAELFKKIIDADGKIDNLVTSAGIMYNKPYMTTSGDELRKTLEVNLVGVNNTCQEALKYMIPRREGKIVNVHSASSRMGNAICSHYSASKFGVMGLTQSIALAVAKDNINVNGICPGMVVTTLGDGEEGSMVHFYMKAKGMTEQEALDALVTLSPMGRFQSCEDMGNAALFLCSDLAVNITGQSLNIDCGMRLN